MLGYSPIFINFFCSKVTVQKRNQSTWIHVCVLTHTHRIIFKLHYSALHTNKDIIKFTFLSIAAMENFSYLALFFFFFKHQLIESYEFVIITTTFKSTSYSLLKLKSGQTRLTVIVEESGLKRLIWEHSNCEKIRIT